MTDLMIGGSGFEHKYISLVASTYTGGWLDLPQGPLFTSLQTAYIIMHQH